MVESVLTVVTGLTAVGAGLIAGVFFAFSAFVMRALARLPAAHGIAAMQSINVDVLNPVFLGVFLGTTLLAAGLVVEAAFNWKPDATVARGIGGFFYVAGTFGVTIACNVPRNNSLAALRPDDAAAPAAWANYVREWTRWNHVRTLAATLSMVALLWSFCA